MNNADYALPGTRSGAVPGAPMIWLCAY